MFNRHFKLSPPHLPHIVCSQPVVFQSFMFNQCRSRTAASDFSYSNVLLSQQWNMIYFLGLAQAAHLPVRAMALCFCNWLLPRAETAHPQICIHFTPFSARPVLDWRARGIQRRSPPSGRAVTHPFTAISITKHLSSQECGALLLFLKVFSGSRTSSRLSAMRKGGQLFKNKKLKK